MRQFPHGYNSSTRENNKEKKMKSLKGWGYMLVFHISCDNIGGKPWKWSSSWLAGVTELSALVPTSLPSAISYRVSM